MFTIFFLFVVQIGFASTNGTEGSTTKSLKQQQQNGQQPSLEDKLDEEPEAEIESPEIELDQDSVEDESVSKYNFIFYFLYKFKYEHEETI